MTVQQITDVVLAVITCVTAVMAALGHTKNAAKLTQLTEDHNDVAADAAVAHAKVAMLADKVDSLVNPQAAVPPPKAP
jgi:hypothetical protein